MVAIARGDGRARARRVADQLHQPGRAWSPRRSSRCSATAPSASATRRRGSAGASPRALGRDAGELWFDYFGLNHLGWLKGVRGRDGELLPGLLEDDARLERLRGGAAVRRRLAALARDDPERVPLLLLLLVRHGRGDPLEPVDARRVPARAAARVLRRATARRPAEALAAWRATRHDRERTYMAEARSAAGDGSEHAHDENAGYESEAMAVLEAIALNTRAVLILNTANRSSAAVPRRARGRRGAVRSSAAPARCRSPTGEVPGARARADRADEGRRADDDRRRADRLARRWRSRRSRCTRSCRRCDRARDLRRLPRAAARARGGVPGMSQSTSPAASSRSSTSRSPGSTALPAAGGGAPLAATSCARPAAARSRRSAPPARPRAALVSPIGADAERRLPARASSPPRACSGRAGAWRARRSPPCCPPTASARWRPSTPASR